jgi:hypothetical protein
MLFVAVALLFAGLLKMPFDGARAYGQLFLGV